MRLSFFLITFIVVSVALFAISRLAPGDTIDNILEEHNDSFGIVTYASYLENRKTIAALYHLDSPPFYFSIAPMIIPKRLYSIPSRKERNWLRKLIYKYKDTEQSEKFIINLQQLELLSRQGNLSLYSNLKSEISKIKYSLDESALKRFNDFLQLLKFENESESKLLQVRMAQNINSLLQSRSEKSISNVLIPKFMWHGVDNQYHKWISNFVSGDFGISLYDRRPVKARIWEALGWTLLLNIFSILFAFLISIPLGVYSAERPGSRFDHFISLSSMMLYALPVFWVATLSITFFASNDWLHWFPSGGLGRGQTAGLGRLIEIMHHLMLPIFCVTYVALAFIIRQVRGAMQDTLKKDFIKTAKAKGLERKQIIWKHGFRNSLTPLITMFSSILPATIAGSVVVEIIFSIPGMGRLAFDGILQQDWNVVFTILLLGTFLTLLGNLFADLIYVKVDPRIILTKDSAANV
jgi:peptide/nickel transport system permease protein